jgi:hypothetical protein
VATPRTAVKRTATKPADKIEAAEELLVEAIEEAVIEQLVEESNTVLIHFVKDGVTAFGCVWYAGQEVEVDRDSDVFRTTLDRNGNSWLDKPEQERLKSGPLAWKLGPSDIPNELIDYPQNFDPHAMTYHKGEWLDLTMLRLRAEQEIARGRSIPKN